MHNQNDKLTQPLFMPFVILRNKKLKPKLGGTPRTALQAVRELKDAGYIIEIGNDGRGKTYKTVEGRLING